MLLSREKMYKFKSDKYNCWTKKIYATLKIRFVKRFSMPF